MTKYKRQDGNIETVSKVVIAPNDPVEIRRLELKNTGSTEEILEVASYFEPVLSTANQDYAHMAFNNLFLVFEELENNRIYVKRRRRGPEEKDWSLCAELYTDAETIGDSEYETDKEKFIGAGNIDIPEMIESSKPYSRSIGLVTEPIIAMKRTIKVMPGETATLDLIIAIAEDVGAGLASARAIAGITSTHSRGNPQKIRKF